MGTISHQMPRTGTGYASRTSQLVLKGAEMEPNEGRLLDSPSFKVNRIHTGARLGVCKCSHTLLIQYDLYNVFSN